MVIGEDYHAIANHEYVWQIDESLYSEFELVTIKKGITISFFIQEFAF